MEESQDWSAEAAAVIQDVRTHVKVIGVSSLESSRRGKYLNITTLEEKQFCVLMGPSGFQMVGSAHDDNSMENTNLVFYETPYAFLSAVSPSYDQSFGNLLMKKLMELSNKQSST